MNRSLQREYSAATIGPARSMSAASLSQHRRGASLINSKISDADNNLDLFSRSRRSVSLPTADESDVSSLKLGKISVVKSTRSGLDDLLTSTEGGKHDYDWLLTPPETPLNYLAEENEFHRNKTVARSCSASRSASTTKPSYKVSATITESSNATSRPTRSSSVSRPSMSYTPSSSNNNYSIRSSSSNILNTSSASVSSYIRPSSPISRSSSTARSSTPSSRSSTQSRNSTPTRGRSSPSLSSSGDSKPRLSVSSRPSTPTSRSTQGPASISPSPVLSSSRPSTPTRRSSISSSSGANLSVSTGRVISNGRTLSSASRPSSPGSRVQSQQQQQLAVNPQDFLLGTPPNLRTTLPDRPISAGRSRPIAARGKGNTEIQGSGAHSVRRASSPMVSRGRSVEPNGPISERSRAGANPNGYSNDVHEPRKLAHGSESPGRRSLRGSTNTDSNGFGRSISKKSIDMAIKHMDIRGSARPVSSTVLYPQSIRSTTSAAARLQYSSYASSNNSSSSDLNGRLSCVSDSTYVSDNCNLANTVDPENNNSFSNNVRLYGRLNEEDNIFESSRYDAILLKEDLKNTNWLHGGDDQNSLFDNGFESLPEPFGLS